MSVKDLATKNTKDTKKVWPKVRLGDVCEVRAGATHHEIVSDTGKYPVYGSGGYICQATTYRCPANTVTIGRKGTLDKPLLIEEPFWNIDTCFGVIPNEALDAKYLWRFCQNFDFYKLIPAIGRPSTNSDAIKSITIPLPPLTVQREIVARLEKELGEADKLAAKFKRVAELADNAFKAELDETFKALEDNSRRDAEARRVRLGDVCERITKGTTPTSVGYCFVESGINFVKIESFSEDGTVLINRVAHISPECHLALKRSQLQAEDVLFSIAGAIGRVAIVGEELLPANTNQALAIIRTSKEKSLDVKFLKYSLCSCSVKEQYVPMQKTTAQSNLSLQNVSDFILSIPTLDAQRAIVAKLDAAKERCEKLKAAAMRGHAAAENLRKAILAEAFEQ